MTELIERLLKAHEDQCGSPDIDSELIRAADALEAAAVEIGRLQRVEVKYKNLCEVLNEHTTEIERLTAALQQIALDTANDTNLEHHYAAIARKALAEEQPDNGTCYLQRQLDRAEDKKP